ncbi:MAG: hypothetical protein ACO1SV_01365 [Fimbriimonas sp.]
MKRAPLPILFVGGLMLAMGNLVEGAPPRSQPRSTCDVSAILASKSDRKPGLTKSNSRRNPKAPRVVVRDPGFVVLQLDGDTVLPGSNIAIVRVSPTKRVKKPS